MNPIDDRTKLEKARARLSEFRAYLKAKEERYEPLTREEINKEHRLYRAYNRIRESEGE